METLELAVNKKKTEYYKDLVALSKFKQVDNSELDSFKLISDLGFINSKAVIERNKIIGKNKGFNDAVRQACESLLLIDEINKYFGEGTILIKRDDFVYLLQKYELAVGNFEDYLGIIPEKNLLEIKDAKEKVRKLYDEPRDKHNMLIDAYRPYTVCKISDLVFKYRNRSEDDIKRHKLNRATIKYLNAFPLVCARKDRYTITTAVNEYLEKYIPQSEVDKISDVNVNTLNNSGMFIAAPYKEIKNSEKHSIRMRFVPIPEDPFVCSLTPYGVVIHSKWGKEAEDETLRKYEDLFTRLRG